MYGAAAFVCMLLLFMWVPAHGFGLSLDEMYRMSLRDENGGILPGYIINRGLTPWPEPKPPTPEERAADTGAGVIRLPSHKPCHGRRLLSKSPLETQDPLLLTLYSVKPVQGILRLSNYWRGCTSEALAYKKICHVHSTSTYEPIP